MPWNRTGLRKECNLANAVLEAAGRRDRLDLERALDELRKRSDQRILDDPKSAKERRVFVAMTGHPEMDALLEAFDSRLAAVLREDVGHWIGKGHGPIPHGIVLWELAAAGDALNAAMVLEGEDGGAALLRALRGEDAAPAPRLVVRRDPATITLDGIPYPLTEAQAVFLDLLVTNLGHLVQPADFDREPILAGVRRDRLKAKLPGPIRAMITGSPGGGYRMTLPPVA